MSKKRLRIVIPREVLLVEIERHCADADCNARTRIGLTKAEARLYDGFECERCERWNDDGLTERDIPDWWEELTITGLDALRARHPLAGERPGINESGERGETGGVGGVVARLSEAWHGSERERRGERSAKDAPEDGGDELA